MLKVSLLIIKLVSNFSFSKYINFLNICMRVRHIGTSHTGLSIVRIRSIRMPRVPYLERE